MGAASGLVVGTGVGESEGAGATIGDADTVGTGDGVAPWLFVAVARRQLHISNTAMAVQLSRPALFKNGKIEWFRP